MPARQLLKLTWLNNEENKERTLTDVLKRSPAGEEMMLLPRWRWTAPLRTGWSAVPAGLRMDGNTVGSKLHTSVSNVSMTHCVRPPCSCVARCTACCRRHSLVITLHGHCGNQTCERFWLQVASSLRCVNKMQQKWSQRLSHDPNGTLLFVKICKCGVAGVPQYGVIYISDCVSVNGAWCRGHAD